MAQTSEIVKTLKHVLKAQGKTYADVAEALDLSEASIKRLFSRKSFSLRRLDQVCAMLEIEISDLARIMNERQQQLQQLSEQQEKEIVEDLSLLLVTVCCLNNWTYEEIVDFYTLSEGECFRKLAQLDRLKIIDLLPGNRIKLRVSPNFSWRPNGPIQAFFQATIGQEFFRSRFSRDDECLIALNGMLSRESNQEFQKRMARLAREFNVMNNDDAHLPLGDRNGVTLVLAMRGWQYGVFSSFRPKRD